MRTALPPRKAEAPVELFRRRRFDRPHRRRSGWRIFAAAFGRAALTVGVPGALALWLMTSERFQLRQVDVTGSTRVPASWVAAAVGVLRGRPLLLISMDEIEAPLRRHPWVAGATIHKNLPDRLHVELRERRPAAVVRTDDGAFYVDAAGRPIDLCPPEAAARHLEIVGAVDRREWITRALRAVDGLRDAGGTWARDLRRVEILGPDDFRVTAPALPYDLVVRSGDIAARLARAEPFLPEIRRRYPHADAVDLRFDRQIVIQFPEA